MSPHELLAAAEAERLRRNVQAYRELHATRGHRDEEGVWRGGLIEFVRHFWSILEPATEFVEGWAIEAMCQHLEAVTFGDTNRGLLNVPPGSMKSLLTNVFLPAWEWGPMRMPHLRYVTFSYSARLTERDNNRFSALIQSPEYQAIYGEWVQLEKYGDQKVSNTATGWKIASSVGGVGTGERGDRVILDDPHNVKEAESETVRTETVRWFRESMSNRLNDPETGAIIIIMQRVHGLDVSGVILDLKLPYTHLMIPFYFAPDRQIDEDGKPFETAIGWHDPRFEEYEESQSEKIIYWPERYTPQRAKAIELEVGPFAWASQYLQSPTVREGGIFERDWWQVWESPNNNFPPMEYIVASIDSAYTEKQYNDPSGLTVWGVFRDEQSRRRIMLIHAWRKRLRFRGPNTERKRGETDVMYQRRAMPHWGLVEWLVYTCRRFKVDRLLIEAKASGITCAQELQRQHGREGWAVQLCPVKGDKVARAHSVQPTFSQGMVYAPVRDWAEMTIEEMEAFPKGKYDDLTDSATQALKHLREIGLAQSDEEETAEETEAVRHRPRPGPLYPV